MFQRLFYVTSIILLLKVFELFSFISWFYGLSVRNNNLNNIMKLCSKTVGVQMTDLTSLRKKRVIQKARK